MTKYDALDAHSELEQTITSDLKKALEKRGFSIKHNGTSDSHAPGGEADIEISNGQYHINVEVTKTTKASADREYLAIKDHLEKVKGNQPTKKCFVWYISPETHYRMINAIREFNISNKDKPDMKILPISFSSFELIMRRLGEAVKEEYSKNQIIGIFDDYLRFVDDEMILEILFRRLFSTDGNLEREIRVREENRHQKIIEDLIHDLTKLEQDLRDYRIALASEAIRNVIFLVFIKLYEEKREFNGQENRFTLSSFLKFQELNDQRRRKKAIHELFGKIKNDDELQEARLFTESDGLSEKMNDDFVIKYFIEPFSRYHFYTTKVDGLGAAYEVLGKLSGKDVKVGQFFTPENVVKFMVRLAELESTDKILDPACGTARFLTFGMEDMLSKVIGSNAESQKKQIRTRQLFGTDDDQNVAKLAKMNMYIHGDGKTNIKDNDGLLLYDFDDGIDVILTNPPLGELTYMKDTYDKEFRLVRMEVIPRKNVTEEKMTQYQERLEYFQNKSRKARDLGKNTNQFDKKIQEYNGRIAECRVLISRGESEIETTGNQLKGGALFINAAKHYLKRTRDANALPEWRGGKLLIILDEGILNTLDYKNVRDFIRKNFYLKAIISLTRDAFVPVSNTSTKTSILYAIRKDDPDAMQKEPIFYAHAERVGIDTKKKVCPNHLFNSGNDILSKYIEFKKKVLASYAGAHFDKTKFLSQGFEKGRIGE
jgi:type I restriction-modification system DNA methylase subunit